jgi:hypothetical protein
MLWDLAIAAFKKERSLSALKSMESLLENKFLKALNIYQSLFNRVETRKLLALRFIK